MPHSCVEIEDFQGVTEDTPNISIDGHTCETSDGVNVVSFGRVDGRRAVTCTWGYDDGGTFARITSSDTRLNEDLRWYIDVERGSCYDQFSIEAVMTHEFGHTFGLGDVGPEEDHAWLTMSPELNGKCQNSEASLGRGDVWGVQSLY